MIFLKATKIIRYAHAHVLLLPARPSADNQTLINADHDKIALGILAF